MGRPKNTTARIARLRRHLAGLEGKQYWQRLRELIGAEGLDRVLHADESSADAQSLSRRRFLALTAASLGLAGLNGCGIRAPEAEIIPYVRPPRDIVPGKALYFATAMPQDSAGIGLVVESREGRPIKIEGNRLHPASLGASDVFCQAAILELYDPDRAKSFGAPGRPRTWEEMVGTIRSAVARMRERKGRGLRVLTEPICSPSLGAQLQAVLRELPAARWHQYQPLTDQAARDGAQQALGRNVNTYYRLDRADVVLSLDADLFTVGPAHVRYARDFMERRRAAVDAGADRPALNRLYMVQSSPTATGVKADHCWPLRPSEVEWFTRAIAARIGDTMKGLDPGPGPIPEVALTAIARDLAAHRGACAVVPGRGQSAAVHALAHAINAALGNPGKTVIYTEPLEVAPTDEIGSLRELAADMDRGAVEMLLILGGNPVYDAPADLQFAERLGAKDSAGKPRVPLSVHYSLYDNETTQLCSTLVPQAHWLESWGDVRAFDGTVSVIQPLIAPLHGGRMYQEMVAALGPWPAPAPDEAVRDHWRRFWQEHRQGKQDFANFWTETLRAGVVAGTALEPLSVKLGDDWQKQLGTYKPAAGMEITFRPDPCVGDGRWANNGWLQELPKPITKLCWGNAALVSRPTADKLGLKLAPTWRGGERGEIATDVLELRLHGRTLRVPAWVAPGQPDGAVTLYLGHGRERAGRVGTGVGANAYALRGADRPWTDTGLEIVATGQRRDMACTQFHQQMEGRELVRFQTTQTAGHAAESAHDASHGPHAGQALTFYPEYPYTSYKWAMAIDLGACVGCNACVVACQAENNIPVIGEDQVKRARSMHWIRMDHYQAEADHAPGSAFQPVPCMQCENAPCEVVCPVAATVHSDEGLNDMVYNRCVGTRYCSNNCPYKVRRFNFLHYAAGTELSPLYNPEVTVRSRGVMEKCTYCVQRIAKARIRAAREERRIRDGEAQTACQEACPAHAITFGDLNDPTSEIARWTSRPRNYALLEELNTQPRTTYLSVITNPNPEIRSA
jgi:molybdopterin-containing oxidoreductase family iron-sulfur binding subunit